VDNEQPVTWKPCKVIHELLRNIYHTHSGRAFRKMPQHRLFIRRVFHCFIYRDRSLFQVYVVPRKGGKLSPAQPGKHHNDRYSLPPVRRFPYPALFLCGQRAPLFNRSYRLRDLHKVDRIRGNDPADGPLHNLLYCGFVESHGTRCKALLHEVKQNAFYIVGAHVPDLVAVQLRFPHVYGMAVVFFLPLRDGRCILEALKIIGPLCEAVPLGKHIQSNAELCAYRRFLVFQL